MIISARPGARSPAKLSAPQQPQQQLVAPVQQLQLSQSVCQPAARAAVLCGEQLGSQRLSRPQTLPARTSGGDDSAAGLKGC